MFLKWMRARSKLHAFDIETTVRYNMCACCECTATLCSMTVWCVTSGWQFLLLPFLSCVCAPGYCIQVGSYDPMPNNKEEKLVAFNMERIK